MDLVRSYPTGPALNGATQWSQNTWCPEPCQTMASKHTGHRRQSWGHMRQRVLR